jgi:hypothetical protein
LDLFLFHFYKAAPTALGSGGRQVIICHFLPRFEGWSEVSKKNIKKSSHNPGNVVKLADFRQFLGLDR